MCLPQATKPGLTTQPLLSVFSCPNRVFQTIKLSLINISRKQGQSDQTNHNQHFSFPPPLNLLFSPPSYGLHRSPAILICTQILLQGCWCPLSQRIAHLLTYWSSLVVYKDLSNPDSWWMSEPHTKQPVFDWATRCDSYFGKFWQWLYDTLQRIF